LRDFFELTKLVVEGGSWRLKCRIVSYNYSFVFLPEFRRPCWPERRPRPRLVWHWPSVPFPVKTNTRRRRRHLKGNKKETSDESTELRITIGRNGYEWNFIGRRHKCSRRLSFTPTRPYAIVEWMERYVT
jgi:hypothetical protein